MVGQLSKWFRGQGVKNGEWYGEVKAFMRRAAKANLTADAAAVLYILRLHTVAFRTEKAIKQVVVDEKTTRVSVTPADLMLWTGLERQKVRDALAELDEKGFCTRRAADGGKLRKGQVDIYCWTVPRAPKTVDQIVPPQGYKVFKKINNIASIADLKVPLGFVPSPGYISHVEKAYLEYKEATKVPQERLKEALIVAPGAPAYKDERKTLKKGEGSTTKEQTASPAGAVPTAEEDVVVVSRKLGIRTSTGQAFVSACRDVAPKCTVEQIVAAIDAVDATIDKRKYKNPTGILLEAVPPKLAAEMKATEEWIAANTATCWGCHKPIYPEEARMRGAHQACWEAEEARSQREGPPHDRLSVPRLRRDLENLGGLQFSSSIQFTPRRGGAGGREGMKMAEYSIGRRYAQLLETQQERTLTEREAAVLAILRDCVERYETEETAAAPARGKA